MAKRSKRSRRGHRRRPHVLAPRAMPVGVLMLALLDHSAVAIAAEDRPHEDSGSTGPGASGLPSEQTERLLPASLDADAFPDRQRYPTRPSWTHGYASDTARQKVVLRIYDKYLPLQADAKSAEPHLADHPETEFEPLSLQGKQVYLLKEWSHRHPSSLPAAGELMYHLANNSERVVIFAEGADLPMGAVMFLREAAEALGIEVFDPIVPLTDPRVRALAADGGADPDLMLAELFRVFLINNAVLSEAETEAPLPSPLPAGVVELSRVVAPLLGVAPSELVTVTGAYFERRVETLASEVEPQGGRLAMQAAVTGLWEAMGDASNVYSTDRVAAALAARPDKDLVLGLVGAKHDVVFKPETSRAAGPLRLDPASASAGQSPAGSSASSAARLLGERKWSANSEFVATELDRTQFRQEYGGRSHGYDFETALGFVRPWAERAPEFADLTDEELVAIRDYTGGSSEPINIALRNDDPAGLQTYDTQIRLITSGLNKLPGHTGRVHRGIAVRSQDMDALLARYQVGEVVIEPAFVTTDTEGPQYAPQDLVFEILSHGGGKLIAPISMGGNREHEVLFPPGTPFRVVDAIATEMTMNGRGIGSFTWKIVLEDLTGQAAVPQTLHTARSRVDEHIEALVPRESGVAPSGMSVQEVLDALHLATDASAESSAVPGSASGLSSEQVLDLATPVSGPRHVDLRPLVDDIVGSGQRRRPAAEPRAESAPGSLAEILAIHVPDIVAGPSIHAARRAEAAELIADIANSLVGYEVFDPADGRFVDELLEVPQRTATRELAPNERMGGHEAIDPASEVQPTRVSAPRVATPRVPAPGSAEARIAAARAIRNAGDAVPPADVAPSPGARRLSPEAMRRIAQRKAEEEMRLAELADAAPGVAAGANSLAAPTDVRDLLGLAGRSQPLVVEVGPWNDGSPLTGRGWPGMVWRGVESGELDLRSSEIDVRAGRGVDSAGLDPKAAASLDPVTGFAQAAKQWMGWAHPDADLAYLIGDARALGLEDEADVVYLPHVLPPNAEMVVLLTEAAKAVRPVAGDAPGLVVIRTGAVDQDEDLQADSPGPLSRAWQDVVQTSGLDLVRTVRTGDPDYEAVTDVFGPPSPDRGPEMFLIARKAAPGENQDRAFSPEGEGQDAGLAGNPAVGGVLAESPVGGGPGPTPPALAGTPGAELPGGGLGGLTWVADDDAEVAPEVEGRHGPVAHGDGFFSEPPPKLLGHDDSIRDEALVGPLEDPGFLFDDSLSRPVPQAFPEEVPEKTVPPKEFVPGAVELPTVDYSGAGSAQVDDSSAGSGPTPAVVGAGGVPVVATYVAPEDGRQLNSATLAMSSDQSPYANLVAEPEADDSARTRGPGWNTTDLEGESGTGMPSLVDIAIVAGTAGLGGAVLGRLGRVAASGVGSVGANAVRAAPAFADAEGRVLKPPPQFDAVLTNTQTFPDLTPPTDRRKVVPHTTGECDLERTEYCDPDAPVTPWTAPVPAPGANISTTFTVNQPLYKGPGYAGADGRPVWEKNPVYPSSPVAPTFRVSTGGPGWAGVDQHKGWENADLSDVPGEPERQPGFNEQNAALLADSGGQPDPEWVNESNPEDPTAGGDGTQLISQESFDAASADSGDITAHFPANDATIDAELVAYERPDRAEREAQRAAEEAAEEAGYNEQYAHLLDDPVPDPEWVNESNPEDPTAGGDGTQLISQESFDAAAQDSGDITPHSAPENVAYVEEAPYEEEHHHHDLNQESAHLLEDPVPDPDWVNESNPENPTAGGDGTQLISQESFNAAAQDSGDITAHFPAEEYHGSGVDG